MRVQNLQLLGGGSNDAAASSGAAMQSAGIPVQSNAGVTAESEADLPF